MKHLHINYFLLILLSILPFLSVAQTIQDFTQINWSEAQEAAIRNSEGQGMALNGKLYMFGGFDHTKACCTPTARAYSYNPQTNSWTRLADMPPMNGTNFGGVTHAGFTTDGVNIYFGGGYTANSTGTGQIFGTREVWRYNVASNTYTKLPLLPIPIASGQMVFLNGKIHHIGGTNRARTMDLGDHYVLDLSNLAGGWKTLAPLPNPRQHAGATAINGKIYYVGGQHGHDSKLITQNDLHEYNPATNTWTQLTDMPYSLSHISAATFEMGGRLFVIGGESAHGNPNHRNYVLAYTRQTNTWQILSSLPQNRASGIADDIEGVIYYATGTASKNNFKGVPVLDGGGTPPPSTKIEAETNYSILSEVGANVIRVGQGDVQSEGKDVRLPDIGDKIRINFQIAESGQYKLKLRVRSGNSTNATLFWPSGYTISLNNLTQTFSGDPTTVSALSSSYGNGAYFGTMISGVLTLNAGSNTLEIQTNRTWGGVDYIEIETQSAAPRPNLISGTSKASVKSLYPNPIEDNSFVLEFSEEFKRIEQFEFIIYNQFGKELGRSEQNLFGEDEFGHEKKTKPSNQKCSIISANQALIKVDDSLPKGIYIVKVVGPKLQTQTIRFIK
jgi:N-acetylneuraminic acid mutarotase